MGFEPTVDGQNQLGRIHAIWGLGQLGRSGVPVERDLISLARDGDAEVRAQVARVLGDLSSDESVPALIELLQDKSSRIKSLAALSLGKIGSVQAAGPLLKIRPIDIFWRGPQYRHAGPM